MPPTQAVITPHQRRGHRRHAIADRLGRAIDRISGQPDRIEPASAPSRHQCSGVTPHHRCHQQARRSRRADRAHPTTGASISRSRTVPTPTPGDQREKGERHRGLPALGGGERAETANTAQPATSNHGAKAGSKRSGLGKGSMVSRLIQDGRRRKHRAQKRRPMTSWTTGLTGSPPSRSPRSRRVESVAVFRRGASIPRPRRRRADGR